MTSLPTVRAWLALVSFVLLAACGQSAPALVPVRAVAVPSETPKGKGDPVRVEVSGDVVATKIGHAIAEAANKAGFTCPGVFVWGDLREVGDRRPVSVGVTNGGAKLEGFVVCERDMTEFLTAQKSHPRLKSAHGGACELRWGDGQLHLRRMWAGSTEAPLGDLSADGTQVLQKGELLAAIFDPRETTDPTARADAMLPVLARVPKLFLFGMWPLPSP